MHHAANSVELAAFPAKFESNTDPEMLNAKVGKVTAKILKKDLAKKYAGALCWFGAPSCLVLRRMMASLMNKIYI